MFFLPDKWKYSLLLQFLRNYLISKNSWNNYHYIFIIRPLLFSLLCFLSSLINSISKKICDFRKNFFELLFLLDTHTNSHIFASMAPRPLLAQLRNGDHQAFREFFGAYVDRLFRFMRRHTRSHAEAQDLTQVLFIKLWERRATIDPDRPFEVFQFDVEHNMV